MSDPIVVTDVVRVPAAAITVHATRASGPGGQNVNKVATKVELRVDLDAVEGLTEPARDRLRRLATHRLDAAGRLVITSQATRSQAANLDDARAKVRSLIAAALVRPKARRATRPTAQAREARLAGKKQRSTIKRLRARPLALTPSNRHYLRRRLGSGRSGRLGYSGSGGKTRAIR